MTEDEATLGLLGISMGLAAIGLLLMQTGCGGVAFIGTPNGVREWGRYQNGQIAEARAKEGQKGAYWQNEDLREQQETVRAVSPGWLSRWLSGGGES